LTGSEGSPAAWVGGFRLSSGYVADIPNTDARRFRRSLFTIFVRREVLLISVVLHLFVRAYVAVSKAKCAENLHFVLSSPE
jgi:uncharacterized protein YrrD